MHPPRSCGAMQAGVVDSKQFTDAFFGLYMGADPVSKDGRSSIARGLASLVAQPYELKAGEIVFLNRE